MADRAEGTRRLRELSRATEGLARAMQAEAERVEGGGDVEKAPRPSREPQAAPEEARATTEPSEFAKRQRPRRQIIRTTPMKRGHRERRPPAVEGLERQFGPGVRPRARGGVVQPGLAPDFIVEGAPGEGWKITAVATGEVIHHHTLYGHPLSHPLAEIVRFRMEPGRPTTVLCHGEIPPLYLGGGQPGALKSAFWESGQGVRDLTIIGEDRWRTILQGASFLSTHGEPTGIRIENFTVRGRGETRELIGSAQDHRIGLINLVGLDIKGSSGEPGKFGGKGMKWGIRLNANRNQLDLFDVHVEPCQEWSLYCDSLQRSRIKGLQGGGNGRGLMQLVARADEGRDPSRGGLLIDSCVSEGNDAGAGGGSDFTLVGHIEGTVHVRRCRSSNSASGSLVCWSDHGHGAWTDEEGYTTTSLLLEDFVADCPDANRAHVQVSGCGRFEMRGGGVAGNKTALDLWPVWGGPVDNNEDGIQLPPSDWNGWKAHRKVRYGHERDGYEHVLTDEEIDSYAPADGNAR